MKFEQLLRIAMGTINERSLGKQSSCGQVAAALLTDQHNVHTGVCIDTPCSMGFCAEHAAIAAMITAGESKIVAVYKDGNILPPCGRCREFILQIHEDNIVCEVMLPNRVATIDELLPDRFC